MTVSRGIARGALGLTPCASRASEFLHIGPSGRRREEDAKGKDRLDRGDMASRSHVSAFMVIVAHQAGVRRPAVAHRQHFREKLTTCPFALLRGHYLVRTISVVRMLGCAIPFR